MDQRDNGQRKTAGTGGDGAADTAAAADERQHAPSAARTAPVIAAVLDDYLPARGTVLEVASGTGEHIVHFAPLRPGITWLPSDPSPQARRSIAAWTRAQGLGNVEAPRALDLTAAGWYRDVPEDLAAVLASNLLHISPWEATLGLLQGAAARLAAGGRLFVYGCFRVGGTHLTANNAAFDDRLRAQDPHWGVRDIGEVADAAAAVGLRLEAARPTPADNRLLILARAG